MSKKNKIILSSVVLFIIIIIIGYYVSYHYVFKKKQIIYIPKSLTTTLYSTNDRKYYQDIDSCGLSIYRYSNINPMQFYDDLNISTEKSKKILDYLNGFNITEIHPIKFLTPYEQTKINTIKLVYHKASIYIDFPYKSIFEITILADDDYGNGIQIHKTYLIKDDDIDYNYLEGLLKD